jgi:putative membrane protein
MSAIAQGTEQPTDPQIAHIAYTAGQIDIEVAKQALDKSHNKDIKGFAEEMVRDHEAVKKKQ